MYQKLSNEEFKRIKQKMKDEHGHNTFYFRTPAFRSWVNHYRKEVGDSIRFRTSDRKVLRNHGVDLKEMIKDFYETLIKNSLEYPHGMVIPNIGKVSMRMRKKTGYKPVWMAGGILTALTPFDTYMYYLFSFKHQASRIKPELRSYVASKHHMKYSKKYIEVARELHPENNFYNPKLR